MAAPKTLRVTQVKSTIGFDKTQLTTIRGLGLRRLIRPARAAAV